MRFRELDTVVLTTDHPEAGVRAGDLGTVVAAYEGTDGLEVEFFRANGDTKAVVTLPTREVRKVNRSEVLAVRSTSRRVTRTRARSHVLRRSGRPSARSTHPHRDVTEP